MNKEHRFSLLFMLCTHTGFCAESYFSGVTGGAHKAQRSSNIQPDKSSIKLIVSATGRRWHQILDDPKHPSASSGSWAIMQTLFNLKSPTPRTKEIIAWPQLLMHTLFAHFPFLFQGRQGTGAVRGRGPAVGATEPKQESAWLSNTGNVHVREGKLHSGGFATSNDETKKVAG